MLHPQSTAAAMAAAACESLAQAVQLPLLALDPSGPIDLGICSPQTSGLAWMLMNNVLLGCLLPLRLAFLAERRMKLQWAAACGRGCAAQPTTVVFELGVLMMLAAAALLVTRALMLAPIFDVGRCPPLWSQR
jgi:hypothetical protein